MKTVDVLIIGQGLAGSTLTWRLAERGISFLVVDRGGVDDHGRPSASRVAAGLLTPITGKRLTLAPTFAEARAVAERFYRGVEHATSAVLLDARPALRLFKSADERRRFNERRADPAYAEQTRPLAIEEKPAGVRAEFGGFWMPGAARLNTPAYLDATRGWLERRNAFRRAEITPEQVVATSGGWTTCEPIGVRARRVVFCQGCTRSPGWPEMQGRVIPAAGEVLRVSTPQLALNRVLHKVGWVAPAIGGATGEHHVGATYDWDRDNPIPTAAGRNKLLGQLRVAYDGPVEVLDHQAALRPTTSDRTPITRVAAGAAFFNGLGTKGALLAPLFSDRLATELAARLRTPAREE